MLSLLNLSSAYAAKNLPNKWVQVVRPKYFVKTKRVEFGLLEKFILDKAFHYVTFTDIYAATHFSDSFIR